MIKLFKLASGVMLLSFASVATQAALIVQGGEVTGADGVILDGQSRTFDFVDGTFADLFDSTLYTFDTVDPAIQIAAMFTGTPAAASPSLVRGCEFVNSFDLCFIHFPQVQSNAGNLLGYAVSLGLFTRGPTVLTWETDLNTVDNPESVFAVLRPTAVPEPSTMGLIALSLLSLGFARRTQNKT